jgi:putative ABC transport system substrate-binding protein
MKLNQQLEHKQRIIVIACLIVIGLLLAACGITQPKTFTIGVINLTPVLDPVFEGFKAGMTEQGYIEGENVTYIYEGPTGSIDKLESVAQSLLEVDVDLILSLSTPATLAGQRATTGTDMPIVFAPLTDPVGAGIIQSLTQPGGNLTGIMLGMQEDRRLDWLLKADPTIKQIYIPYNSNDRSPMLALEIVSEAASKLGVEIVTREARNAEEIVTATENIPETADAVFILPDSLVTTGIPDFVKATKELGLPLSVPSAEQVEQGALISFSSGLFSSGEQAARLAGQILKGAKPADLPVEMSEVVLLINLQTAEAIGLEIPDDVIRDAHIIIR